MAIALDMYSVVHALRNYAPDVAEVTFKRDKNFVGVYVNRLGDDAERVGWIEYSEFKKMVGEGLASLEEIGEK